MAELSSEEMDKRFSAADEMSKLRPNVEELTETVKARDAEQAELSHSPQGASTVEVDAHAENDLVKQAEEHGISPQEAANDPVIRAEVEARNAALAQRKEVLGDVLKPIKDQMEKDTAEMRELQGRLALLRLRIEDAKDKLELAVRPDGPATVVREAYKEAEQRLVDRGEQAKGSVKADEPGA